VDFSARTRTVRGYLGTEDIFFNVRGEHERLAITPEVELTTEAPTAAGNAPAASYTTAGGKFMLRTSEEPKWEARPAVEVVRRTGPRTTLKAVCELIPERFEYRPGRDIRRLDGRRPPRGCAGTGSPRPTGRAPVRRPERRHDSVEVYTHAWIEALPPAENGEQPAWVGAGPTNRKLAGDTHMGSATAASTATSRRSRAPIAALAAGPARRQRQDDSTRLSGARSSRQAARALAGAGYGVKLIVLVLGDWMFPALSVARTRIL
jgi:hypothetical protein